ncbi:MAG: carbohydrate kinase family protein [Methylohalobius sp. ZOD2]|nr:carbohydrate kinase [Methylothermaceae bacterium]
MRAVDVICIGHAAYDLVFSVPHHPGPDEKCTATGLIACGGGPAANAAVTVARLERQAAFVGYLGHDLYGEAHRCELVQDGVDSDWLCRGDSPTPLSTILVKPDGRRALVNYRGATRPLAADAVDLSGLDAKVVLFDGHEPHVSCRWLPHFRDRGAATVLDAGSLHEGTRRLMFEVDYLIASRKFAAQWLGYDEPRRALGELAAKSPAAVITLGEEGLIWQRGDEYGEMAAFPVDAVDTTGAGDSFHGAFAVAVAEEVPWANALRFASAAAALCCTQMGARPGIPGREAVEAFCREIQIEEK